MKILVSGKNIEISNALRMHIEESISTHVQKDFDNVVSVNVTLSKQRHLFETDIRVNEVTGNGIAIKGQNKDSDAYRSVDDAAKKMAKQLRRYKNKLKDHHRKRSIKETMADMINLHINDYVISPHNQEDAECFANNPVVIAEKKVSIETMTVSDAVMKMDLENLPAMIFINNGNNRINIVHYRNDGNIAWVDIMTNVQS